MRLLLVHIYCCWVSSLPWTRSPCSFTFLGTDLENTLKNDLKMLN
jgi:hypothetical protein